MKSDTCAYCGVKARHDVRLCSRCWGGLCLELRERIASTWNSFGDGPNFKNAVEDGVRFLMWKAGLLD